jgi:hypothetical protein
MHSTSMTPTVSPRRPLNGPGLNLAKAVVKVLENPLMEKTLASWQKGLCWIGGVAIFLAVWQAVSWIGEYRLPGVPTVASAVCTDSDL